LKKTNFLSSFKDLSAVGVANIIPTAIGGLFWFYVTTLIQVEHKPKLIIEKMGSIEEYITLGKEIGLNHLVVDDREYPQYRMKFLKDVFEDEEKYPYLIRVFNSKDFDYNYRLKIFEIDYDKFADIEMEKVIVK